MNYQESTIEQQITEVLKQFPELKLALLFGSYAQGNETKDCDLDIAVAADKTLTVDQKMKIIEELAIRTRKTIDLIDLQKKHEPIFSQAITKGKKLFCNDAGLYAEFMKTVMFNAADFIPIRSRILRERREAWINS